MANLALDPLFAGAIFTEDEIKLIAALVIAVLIIGLIACAFFIRSLIRIATQEEKSKSDFAIVAVGALLLLNPLLSWATGSIEKGRRGGREENAMELIYEVSNRSADEFTTGRWHDFQDCSFYKVDLNGAERSYRSAEILVQNNEIIRREAALFEASGWEVARYADFDEYTNVGFAFRADLGEHALTLQDWGGLGFSYLDSDCPARTGGIDSERVPVAEFPAS